MNSKNEVFEYLIDQLRQHVSNNPYKQQCEDLAHEVLSLKSELARYKKPYIAYAKKTDWVQGDSRFLKKWGKHRADILRECIQEQDAEIQSLKNQLRDASVYIKELHLALAQATGDVEAYKLIRKGDTPGCKHNWLRSKHRTGLFCSNCGARKDEAQECEHAWRLYRGSRTEEMCIKCGSKR